jgi:hypothetical protein
MQIDPGVEYWQQTHRNDNQRSDGRRSGYRLDWMGVVSEGRTLLMLATKCDAGNKSVHNASLTRG